MDIWLPVEALGVVATGGIAAWAAFLAKSAAEKSNSAASSLAKIEGQRRKSELCPRLRVTFEPWGPGTEGIWRLRVVFVGPPGLDRLDRLTVGIRDDHFRRGESQQIMGGPTTEEIKAHVWGPYRFSPGIGPDEARADGTGRTVDYNATLPIGEELPFELDNTRPGYWMGSMTQEDWQRQRGTVARLAFTAEHEEYGKWYLPCEIETAILPVTVYVP